MAVYTHFGNMAGLLEAMTDEATSRLTEAVTHVPHTDDPVAEFFVVGLAYYRFAMTNPQRYELIMGTASTPQPLLDIRTDVTVTGRPTDRADRSGVLRGPARRGAADDRGRRIRDDGCLAMTARLWTICHGAVSLELAWLRPRGPRAHRGARAAGRRRHRRDGRRAGEPTMRSLATAMELMGANGP